MICSISECILNNYNESINLFLRFILLRALLITKAPISASYITHSTSCGSESFLKQTQTSATGGYAHGPIKKILHGYQSIF